MDAAEIHHAIGAEGWRGVLIACGIDEKYLRNKHGPCPACGGKDRFRFDNKRGQGNFFCNNCGAGDGFKLVMQVASCTFVEARRRVIDAAGLAGDAAARAPARSIAREPERPEVAKPTRRVVLLLNESCAIENCDPARTYLASRGLWPLPEGTRLKAHPSVEYWHDSKRVGRFPALVTAIRNSDAGLVTVHVTYLTPEGLKLSEHEPRKILSPMTGHEGCAARIMDVGAQVMGIAEGIETALSAAKLTGIPTWAAINTALLAKFEPPEQVTKLVIFADRDVPGLEAASQLMQRLQEKVRLEIRTPKAKDWNDVLVAPQ
jgi:putative DNA primase/helicase